MISAFAAQRTPVDMVSIGNEIRNGMLWPVGQVDWTANTGWDNLTTLLKAGVAGARAGNPRRHQLLVMLHFDQGGDNTDSRTFYDNMVSRRRAVRRDRALLLPVLPRDPEPDAGQRRRPRECDTASRS